VRGNLEQGSFSLNHFIDRKAAILLAKNSESVIGLEAITLSRCDLCPSIRLIVG
jgi:hypothetical protein